MANEWTSGWDTPVKTGATPPGVRSSTTDHGSILMEPVIGFQNELVGALQIAKNVAGVAESASRKLSEWTGVDMSVSMDDVRKALESYQEDLAPVAPTKGGSPARALLRGVGAAPVQLAEYGLATLATRRPTLAFALVDAAREADKGWKEAVKAGAIGAASGAVQGQISKIPSLLTRTAAGAAAGGAQAKIQGGEPEDIIAGMLMGGGFGALSHEKMPDVRRGPDGQPLAFISRDPKKDVTPVISYLESPHLKFEHVPGAVDVVTDAINATGKIDARTESWNIRAREALRGARGAEKLNDAERHQLITYLNDPQYSTANPPPGSAKMQAAFSKAREVTEEARKEILALKREQWVAERAEPPEAVWAAERQRLGRPLTQAEAEAFKAKRIADLAQQSTTTIPDFGREGYFPHTFEGPWKTVMVDAQGNEKPIEVGGWLSETRRDAEIKAEQYAQQSGLPRDRVIVAQYEPTASKGHGAEGKRFFGNVEQRKSDLPGWVHDEEALYQYLGNTSRYLELSRLRPKMQKVRGWIEDNMPDSSTLKQWRNYEDKVEGRPDQLTKAVNDYVVKNGGRPDFVQRSTGFIRGVESLAKLGFSPASALTNTSQYWLNSVPVLGRYAWTGFKGATETFTQNALRKAGMGDIIPKGAKDYNWLLEEMNIRSEAHKGDVLSQADRFRLYYPKDEKSKPQYWLNAINHFGLWMFSNAEYLNRAGTVIGAYEKAISKGMSKEAAIRKAREVEVRTQFTYGAADAPMALNNPWMKTAFQFQNYFLKQMEFMLGTTFGKSQYGKFDSRKQELGRMLGATLLATGAVGLPGIETFDSIMEAATGYSILNELNKSESPLLRNASRGLPGMIGHISPHLSGIDLSRSIGYGDYFSANKLTPKFGPAVNEAVLVLGALAANQGADTDSKVNELLGKISPQGRRIVESFMKDSKDNAQVLDSKGRLIMGDLKPFEQWATRLGFSTVGVSEEREKYIRDNEEVSRAKSKREGYVNVISRAIKDGDTQRAQQLADEAAKEGYPGLWGTANKKAQQPRQTRREAFERRNRKYLRNTTPAPARAGGNEWTTGW